MLVVGLTGGIGSGKSTIAGEFKRLGAYIIDADKIARKILSPQTNAGKKIVNYFGKQILYKRNATVYINRKKLSRIVFFDRKKLKKLNELMHPLIINQIKKEIRILKRNTKLPGQIIMVDAPLLFETGLNVFMDKIIVISVSRACQIERIKKRNGLNKKEILQRINKQWPLRKKIEYADYLVDNSKNRQKTRKKVEHVWQKLFDLE